MIRVVETLSVIEVITQMPMGRRILFAVMGLFPLLAPYELIVQVDWKSYLNTFFLFTAMISIGAMAVSAFLFWAAIAGLDSSLKLDCSMGWITMAMARSCFHGDLPDIPFNG